jgi:adenylate cyclase
MPDGGSNLQGWFGELKRRKVFRVAVMYLLAAWVVIQVADAVFEPLGLPPWSMKLVIVLAVLGFPVACALAWAFDVSPAGIERTPARRTSGPGGSAAVAGAAPSAAAGTAASLVAPPPAPAESVAILPFVDLSPERDQEYFCEGIAEEIVNALCCIRGLRIASRTSASQFKGRSVDVREIGRSLGVGSVLEGSVRKSGDRVRITAQLVGSADGYHLWSESFDRRLEDIFAIQSEIAQKLVAALRLSLTRQETALIERRGTRNAEAYDHYLRGQALLRDGTDSTLPKAVAAFRAAIECDPKFAQAHAGLANAVAIRGQWRLDVTPGEFKEAFAEINRALELEPRMPEAFVARACLMSMQQRNREASEAFEEAIRLNPASYEAHYMYARHCFATGEFERSVTLFETAMKLRPDDYQPVTMVVGAMEKLGHPEVRQAKQRAMAAIDRHLELEPEDGRALQLGAVQAANLGDLERTEELARRALAARPDEFATYYNLGCAFALLGRRERALELLDRAVHHGRGNLEWFEQDPDLDSLRGDARFEEIVGRLRSARREEAV